MIQVNHPEGQAVRFTWFLAVSIAILWVPVSKSGRVSAARVDAQTKRDDSPATVSGAPAPIELREGLAIASPARDRRAAISTDPITAQVIAGQWTMPRAGDTATVPGGRPARWESVKAGADGWFSHPSLRGGYIAFTVPSAEASVMMLEASGHSLVYAGGEPRRR